MYAKFEALLKERGVTAADVSRATGITHTVFANWKARGGGLSVENLKKVADFFGVAMEYFVTERKE